MAVEQDLQTKSNVNVLDEEINISEVAQLESIVPSAVIDLTHPLENSSKINAAETNLKQNSQNKPTAKENTTESDIRVPLSKLESLNNYVGELVILQGIISQINKSNLEKTYQDAISQLSKLSKEIHQISMSLRMVPLKGIVQKLQRIIRDTSKGLNKDIVFHIQGDETEIDKTLLDQLSDPLVHIVRNSVDHGIESEDERQKNNKSEKGTVFFKAFYEGNHLILEITDNGRGMDEEKILKKAIAQKLVSPTAQLNKQQILQLIFKPGLSTKEQTSEVSGRGVGMDVVKTNIEKLGGEVTLFSDLGKGSTVRLKLPLTLAVIDSLISTIGNQRYVLPLSQVQETLNIDHKSILKSSGSGELLNLRGDIIPVQRIDNILNKKSATNEDEGPYTVVIVKNEGEQTGFIVDDIISQQHVVIKNIFVDQKIKEKFIGSAILGDGMPSLILDLHYLSQITKRAL